MKSFFLLLLTIFTVSGTLAAEKMNKPEIKTVDNYIAVFDFEVTTGDKGISRPLTESVRREIVMSGKYKVIDRGNMEKILGEQKLQMSGCVTGECIVEAGQLLGVGKLISGTVSMVGKTYYLTLSLISVRTGEIENVADDKCKCEVDELLDSTKRLAEKLLGEEVEQPAAKAPASATVAIPKPEMITLEKSITHDITGIWHWSVRSPFVPDRTNTIKADGSCTLNSMGGTWSYQEGDKNKIVFHWDDTWTHTMTLSKDGLSMTGTDDWGTRVTGRKVGDKQGVQHKMTKE
jgi:hypothetical protein